MAKRKSNKSEQSLHGSKNKEGIPFSIEIYKDRQLAQPENPLAVAHQAIQRIKDNLEKNVQINEKSKRLVAYSQSIAQKIKW